MAGFLGALALGARLGAQVLGGISSGTLPNRLRYGSGIAAILLCAFALIVLARAGSIAVPDGWANALAVGSWAITAYMVVNTLGNLASKSRLERTVFAATTAVLAVLCGFVALTA
jgi:hypothetical protein